MNEAQLTVALAQMLKVIENLAIVVTEQQKSIIQLRADMDRQVHPNDRPLH